MSCEDGDGECADVLRDVWLFLDDEMDVGRRATVQHHLDDCSPCLAEAGLTQKLKQLLHTKCGGDRAPEELRQRLVTRLTEVQTVQVSDGSGTTTTVRTTQVQVSGD